MKSVGLFGCVAMLMISTAAAQPFFEPAPPLPPQDPAPAARPRPANAPNPPNPPARRDVEVEVRGLDAEIRARVNANLRSNRDIGQVYRNGTRFLDRGDWERAIEMFTQVIERRAEHVDGAYYWKAYALGKWGKRGEALAQLAELEKVNPKSRWLDDARALGVELRQASGQAVSADAQNDDELKLIALNGLVEVAPERAIPAVRDLMRKSTSPRLKERALFVLAQSNSPQAKEILAQFARGGGNPDVQLKAVEYLGMQKDNGQLLSEIYAANNDSAVRRRVLQAYMMSRDKDRIFQAARSEQDPELRREAISLLGGMKAEPELLQLYPSETNPDSKRRILHSLRGANSVKALIDIARKETSPELKKEAVQMLTSMHTREATDFLMELVNK
jgi:tetratricopeptide (TPR) repeat protein